MKRFFSYATGLYMYGSVHIGLGAGAMTLMSFYLLQGSDRINPDYILCLFTGTICLYSVHRLASLASLKEWGDALKYKRIGRVQTGIRILILLSAAFGSLHFLRLDSGLKLLLLSGGLLTLLYTFPATKSGSRLKDVAMIKIFLISVLWGLTTAAIPAWILGSEWPVTTYMLAERSIFIFALTLPFDMRDYVIDIKMDVKTWPGLIGMNNSLKLSVLMLTVLLGSMILIAWQCGIYTGNHAFLLFLTNLLTALLVGISVRMKSDYYFTGILDGMLIIQPIFLILLSR